MTADPLAGTRYRIQRLPSGEPKVLGAGGIGIVYEAVDTGSGERVAVKVLRPELAADDTIRKRALREATRLAGLDHRCIVKFRESGETKAGLPFIVMELLEGRTLTQHLDADGPFAKHEALRIMLEVLEGLSFMHERDVIHRDLKLDNVFLTEDGRVKILDLGLAKELRHPSLTSTHSSLTSKGMIIGTPRYTSPEQAAGLRADQRSDVYTSAYLFYTMITGRLPFEEVHDARDLLLAHAIRPTAPPSRYSQEPISSRLDATVLKALEKEPADRFQTAQQFARALYQADQTATDVTPPAAGSLSRSALPTRTEGNDGESSAAAVVGSEFERGAGLPGLGRVSVKILISLAIFGMLTIGMVRLLTWLAVRHSP